VAQRLRCVGCLGIVNGCGGYPVMMTSAVQQSADGNCVSVSTCDQLSQEPLLTESPPLLARHMPTQNMVSALPFFNMMIPVADNFGGPVNVSVSPSVDPSGADLPINGMSWFFCMQQHIYCGCYLSGMPALLDIPTFY